MPGSEHGPEHGPGGEDWEDAGFSVEQLDGDASEYETTSGQLEPGQPVRLGVARGRGNKPYTPGDTSWQERAACRAMDPNIFFPSDQEGVREAKSVCNRCPVKEPCLELALRTGQDNGVWGGASERERKRMKRQRRLAAEADRKRAPKT